MHELPQDLASSLRSYRGSIYGGSRRGGGDDADDVDLEKGVRDDDRGEGADPPNRSPTLHRTQSNPDLYQARQEQADNHDDPNKQAPLLRFESYRNSQHRPRIDTNIKKSKSHHDAQTPAPLSVIQAPPVKDLDPAAERLAEDHSPLTEKDFYELMGMRPPRPSIADDAKANDPKSLAVPHGLFSRILHSLAWTQRKYRVFSVAVYVFLVLQLAISAVFIILGALSHIDTHITIAILGAVSTIIAGGLALMQGQGLPNRLRMSRDALRSVVFEAEELYWDMRTGRTILYKDVKKLREDYLRVLEEQKRNHPDAWNSVTNTLAHGATKGGEGEGGITGGIAGGRKG